MKKIDCILPAQWQEVDLDGDVAGAARAIAGRMTSGRTGDKVVAARARVERSLREQFVTLASVGAHLLLMEVDPVGGMRTGTFLVFLPFPRQDSTDPLDTLMAVASSTPGAVVLEAGDLVALRTMTTVDRTEDIVTALDAVDQTLSLGGVEIPGDAGVRALDLTYYVGHPDRPDDWVQARGTITVRDDESGHDLAEALLGVCDAIIESTRLS